MESVKPVVGKWGAYSIESDCCQGFGIIIEVSPSGSVTIEGHHGGRNKASVPEGKVKVFDAFEEASACFHRDDEKRRKMMSVDAF